MTHLFKERFLKHLADTIMGFGNWKTKFGDPRKLTVTSFERCDRVWETTAPVPCVSGIGTGHSNASHGQEPPLPLT